MLVYVAALLSVFVAYLFGSIPVGYLVARAYGIDVTTSGSGRIGGTNVLRAVGAPAAGLTVAGDVFKGLIPVYLLKFFFPAIAYFMAGASPDIGLITNVVVALAMPATVLGHNFSVFLGFRGGVGAGTAVGALAGAHFLTAMFTAIFAIASLAISRYASILSTTVAISGVVLLTIFAMMGQVPTIYIFGAVIIMAIIINALRPNYARLWAGTERRVGTPKNPTPSPE
jgi:glycerol-3-phosphate acyltransferase PlsY